MLSTDQPWAITMTDWLELNVLKINRRILLSTIEFIVQLLYIFTEANANRYQSFFRFSGREMLLIIIPLTGTF